MQFAAALDALGTEPVHVALQALLDTDLCLEAEDPTSLGNVGVVTQDVSRPGILVPEGRVENCKQAAHQYSDLASHLKLIEDVYEEVLDKGRPVKAGFERQDDLIAAVQQMNLRYTQMLEWSVYGGRPRRILRKAANTLFRGPKYPPLGAP